MANALVRFRVILKKVAAFLFLIVFATSRSTVSAQVNLQTGSATFSIPMFSWKDDRSRLYSSVTLSYNSGNGLKVNAIASSVGQGWDLIAGGMISRMQVGLPDDQISNGTTSAFDRTKIAPGYLYAPIDASTGCPIAMTKYPIYKGKNMEYMPHNVVEEDRELDYFSFQFNGKIGVFVLDKNTPGTGVSLGDTKMKISYQTSDMRNLGRRTKISSFVIQDVDGLKYKFENMGVSKLLKTAYCDASLNYMQHQPKFKDEKVYHQTAFEDDQHILYPWIVDNWFLTEISDPLTNRSISFNYGTTNQIDAIIAEDLQYNYAKKKYVLVSHKRTVAEVPILTEIVFPDNHKVTITEGAERADLAGAKALSAIEITYRSRQIARYQLGMTYVIKSRYGTPKSDYEKRYARLYLRSVQKIGVDLKDDSPPYLFDYCLGTGEGDDFVPARLSNMKDVWGYFNGSNSRDFYDHFLDMDLTRYLYNEAKGLCFIRDGRDNPGLGPVLNAKPGLAKNGLLRQIVYPTGGTLTYEYAQNYGTIEGALVAAAGVHVSKTMSSDGGYANDCDHPISTSYNYVLSDGSSSLWGLEMPRHQLVLENHYQPAEKYYHWPPLPFGDCGWRYAYPGVIAETQSPNVTQLMHVMNTISPYLGVIGDLGTIYDAASYFISGTGVGLAIDVGLNLVQLGIDCIGDNSNDQGMISYYNSDLNASNPLPLQFKRVEIVENPAGNGKTIQEFSSDDDYAIWAPTNPTFSMKQRFAPWAYGLPTKTVIKDENGNIVKETINKYSFDDVSYSDLSGHAITGFKMQHSLGLISSKCFPRKVYAQKNPDWDAWATPTKYNDPNSYISQTTSTGDLWTDIYDLYSGMAVLYSTTEKVYKEEDQARYVETEKRYYYNTDNYQVRYVSTNFNQNELYSKSRIQGFQYVTDYINQGTDNPELNTLFQNNVLNEVVAAAEYDGSYMLNERITEYKLVAGDVKPGRILEQRFASPANFYSSSYSPNVGATNSAYKLVQEYKYDGSGNMIGVKDEGGRNITNLFGYDDKYVVAYVINVDADEKDCAYAGFEENSDWNGWQYQGGGGGLPSYSAEAVTGLQSLFIPSGASFTCAIKTGKEYIVSFWATTPGMTVSGGAVLAKTIPGVNGFTYYEFNVPAGNTSVEVSGTGHIDELRLYPKNARMRTVAYDPLIGKISDCDENNRITYYEYDKLGRIQFIKDEKKNIVKMYEYNSVSNQNGCPGTYYNHYISEGFVKNSCGAGYVGGEVFYAIPAGTYSSTISQADADAQAENDLRANGQNFANNTGTCQQIYYNQPLSETFISESCGAGYIGGTITYAVPGGRYSAFTQQEANDMAQAEIDANGQQFANDPETRVCTLDYNPEWEWVEGNATKCEMVNGEMHLFGWALDVNPNSSTYNQSQWRDMGQSSECPAANIDLTYSNSTDADFTIELFNTTTGAQIFINVLSWTSDKSASIPAGTYDVYISTTTYYTYATFEAGCGYYATGSYGDEVDFYGVLLDSACDTIRIGQ